MNTHSGHRFELLKKKHKLTNEEIGSWFGVSNQAVQQWVENGIPKKRLRELAKRLNVDIAWLEFGVEGDKSQPDFIDDKETRKSIGRRLMIEEERLQFNSKILAKETGYSLNSIESFEYGEVAIPPEFFSRLPQQFDLVYILTGNRTQTPEQTSTGLSHQTGNIVNGSIGDGAVNVQGGSFKK